MKRCKWSLTPSPPVVRIALMLLVLFSMLFWAPTVSLAQGPDNLVKLKPGAVVWNVGLDFGGILDIPPSDPVSRWESPKVPVETEWVFRLDSYYDGGYGLILHCFSSNCGLEVKSRSSTRSSSQTVYEGVVFLEQIEFSPEQRQRTANAISRSLEIYRLETKPRILASILNGLVVWEKEKYVSKAFEVFMAVGDRLESCKDKAEFFGKADDLGFSDRIADQLRWLAENFEKKNLSCAAIKKEALPSFNLTGYVLRPRSALVSLAVLPVATMPTAPMAPTVVVIVPPAVTVAAPQVTIVERVVTATPVPVTVAIVPMPTKTSTVLPSPAPIPVRKPGEKDLGEQIVVTLLLIVFLIVFCTLVAVGLYWWFCIRPVEKAAAEEERLEREFAETKKQIEQAAEIKKFELAKTLLLKLQRLSSGNEQKTKIFYDLRDLVAKEEIDSIE